MAAPPNRKTRCLCSENDFCGEHCFAMSKGFESSIIKNSAPAAARAPFSTKSWRIWWPGLEAEKRTGAAQNGRFLLFWHLFYRYNRKWVSSSTLELHCPSLGCESGTSAKIWLWLQPQPFFVNVTIWGCAPLGSWGSSLCKGATRKRRKSSAIGAIANPGLRCFCAASREPRWQVSGVFGNVFGQFLGLLEES